MINKIRIPHMIKDEIARRRSDAEKKVETIIDDAIGRAVAEHIDYPLQNYGKTKEFTVEIVFGEDVDWHFAQTVVHGYLQEGWTITTIPRERKVVLS